MGRLLSWGSMTHNTEDVPRDVLGEFTKFFSNDEITISLPLKLAFLYYIITSLLSTHGFSSYYFSFSLENRY